MRSFFYTAYAESNSKIANGTSQPRQHSNDRNSLATHTSPSSSPAKKYVKAPENQPMSHDCGTNDTNSDYHVKTTIPPAPSSGSTHNWYLTDTVVNATDPAQAFQKKYDVCFDVSSTGNGQQFNALSASSDQRLNANRTVHTLLNPTGSCIGQQYNIFNPVNGQQAYNTFNRQQALSTVNGQQAFRTINCQQALSTVNGQQAFSTVNGQQAFSTVNGQQAFSTVYGQLCGALNAFNGQRYAFNSQRYNGHSAVNGQQHNVYRPMR